MSIYCLFSSYTRGQHRSYGGEHSACITRVSACLCATGGVLRSYLADFHVDAAVVLPDVEVKVLVVNAQVPPLRQLAFEPAREEPAHQ